MNGKSCLIPILQMDECLLINVIVLFVWIMAQPIRCFHHLDVTVSRQLRGIKAGPRWVFPVFFFFFFYIQQTEATIFYTFTNIIIIILISLFLVIIIWQWLFSRTRSNSPLGLFNRTRSYSPYTIQPDPVE